MKIETVDGVGAEFSDIDITSLSDAEFDAVKAAFADHGVIFFRDQSTNEEDHIAFAERFGDININRFFAAHPDYPQIALVAKEPDQKDNIAAAGTPIIPMIMNQRWVLCSLHANSLNLAEIQCSPRCIQRMSRCPRH